MAIKDSALGEDISLSKKETDNDGKSKAVEASPKDPNPQIKNAHATGDGSFGRADESLPDDNEEKNEKDGNY